MTPENGLIAALVHSQMRTNAALTPTAVGALVAFALVIANVPGILDAKNEGWEKVSNDLDTLMGHLDAALAEGDDWIADDQKAFASSLINFKGSINELKKSVDDIAAALEICANAYIVAYVALSGLAGACMVILIGLAILRLYPPAAPGAVVMMAKVGALLTYLSTKITVLLTILLAGLAAFLGSTAYGYMQMNSENRALPTPQQFEKLRIDYAPPATFVAKSV